MFDLESGNQYYGFTKIVLLIKKASFFYTLTRISQKPVFLPNVLNFQWTFLNSVFKSGNVDLFWRISFLAYVKVSPMVLPQH